MTEFIHISSSTDDDVYRELFPQLRGLVDSETNTTANLGNIAAALKQAFPKISWVGFYLWDGRELVLGPFQGKPACVRIAEGKGVCGASFQRREPVIVPDVEKFPGHIVCDPDTRSEIVVPLVGSTAFGVLDVDSAALNAFDDTDRRHLEKVAGLVVSFLQPSI